MSVMLWPVWSSSFSASGSESLSAGWLAIFLLSIGAGDWGVVGWSHSVELDKVGLLGESGSLDAESGVGSVADLDGVWNLVNLNEALGIWSGMWVSHVVWLDASTCVLSIADWDSYSSSWALSERAISWLSSLGLHDSSSAWVVWVMS